jgi:hypothetical protein
MRNAIAHDTRLSGMPQWGNGFRWQVDQFFPLNQFIEELVGLSNRAQGIETLKLMCHGWADPGQNLGFGLQFCAEGITPATVRLFTRLHPRGERARVGLIEIYACGPARVTLRDREPGRAVLGGFRTPGADGDRLMRQLAINSGALVRASTHTQYYRTTLMGEIDWGAWEGTVITYNPLGERVAQETNPT